MKRAVVILLVLTVVLGASMLAEQQKGRGRSGQAPQGQAPEALPAGAADLAQVLRNSLLRPERWSCREPSLRV